MREKREKWVIVIINIFTDSSTEQMNDVKIHWFKQRSSERRILYSSWAVLVFLELHSDVPERGQPLSKVKVIEGHLSGKAALMCPEVDNDHVNHPNFTSSLTIAVKHGEAQRHKARQLYFCRKPAGHQVPYGYGASKPWIIFLRWDKIWPCRCDALNLPACKLLVLLKLCCSMWSDVNLQTNFLQEADRLVSSVWWCRKHRSSRWGFYTNGEKIYRRGFLKCSWLPAFMFIVTRLQSFRITS